MSKTERPKSGGSYVRREDGSLHRLDSKEEAARSLANRKTFPEAVDDLLAEERFSAVAVFDRIKEALGMDSDAELAWWFGLSPQSLWNKKRRNSVPYREAIFIAEWSRSSLAYILTGTGSIDDRQAPSQETNDSR